MRWTRTITCLCAIVPIVLSGCSSYEVKAPVSSRTTAKEPQARVAPRPGSSPRQPAGRSGDHYVVRRGDTLYSIAWQHGLEVKELAALNGIRPPYTIYSGQRLRVSNGGRLHAAPLADRSRIVARPLPRPAAAPQPKPDAAPATAPQPVATASTGQPATPAPAPEQAAGKADFDGTWVWPTRGKVMREFSQNSTGKKGIDIGGHPGQPVNAAAGGKVVYVGSGLVGYGRLIIVKHNESLLSAYGHNSKLLVKEGDHVAAGQMIAKMGSSGTDRTALYFEIRRDGKPVNPLKYLPGI